MKSKLPLGIACAALTLSPSLATERYFTYTYEPETMPQGLFEYEQWITARVGRNGNVGQRNFHLWEFRHEFEYGVTDDYTLSLYVNESLTNFRESGTHRNVSHFQFDGISLENRYLLLNPADHKVGLALYVEPRISGSAAELEEKIILGQRIGDWKWALNLTHATEWFDDFHKTEGEMELSFGIARELGKHWSLGLEVRDHNEVPDYKKWENTAIYLGPVLNYRQERWWATFTVMPQIAGANFADNADGDRHFELEGHERLNVRFVVGLSF